MRWQELQNGSFAPKVCSVKCAGVEMSESSVEYRNNVQVRGSGNRAMVFAHGFGCDQNMWRFVAPAFEAEFTTVLFDHVGAGRSDLSAYNSK
jgi:pimeloyl-ACP methyl ester carboxylesterase